MNIQELKDKVKSSQINDERKQKILSLLSGFVSFDTIEQVKDLIQEDIDYDTTSLLQVEDNGEVVKASDELGRGLSKVEKNLEEDMSFVEKEMNDLSEMMQNMSKALDEAKIESLNASLPQS